MAEMMNNFPSEMKALAQWVNGTKSDIKSENKIPINPLTKGKADPTKSLTWATFEDAMDARTPHAPHIGFVLSSNDPYTIIDLDDPFDEEKDRTYQERLKLQDLNDRILAAFPSYIERSQSGNGYHIIIKGSIPKGVNRDTVEIYSTQRYMVCTGDVYQSMPIVDCQELLTALFDEMAPVTVTGDLYETDEDNELSDNSLMRVAMNAVNGDKFNMLCNGDMSDYVSQSEADFALLAIIAFYTNSNEQVRRIFRKGKLGQREKAIKNDRYINFALEKIRANQPAPTDFDELQARAREVSEAGEEEVREANATVSVDEQKAETITDTPSEEGETIKEQEVHMFPPGLVGEIADYIYRSAARPVKVMGLIGAIGLMAGLVGRQYNISGVGLNHYLILLAKTGAGKEGIASGIDRLTDAARKQIPMVDMFSGPSAFASGPALVKTMSQKTCFLSVLGEFGLTLKEICSPKAQGAQLTLKKELLALYQKSGWQSMLKSSVYSDQEKNTADVRAPNLSILGESTPETFLEGLSESHISDGLIPRFSVLEYKGERPYLNERNGFAPSEKLLTHFLDVVKILITMQGNDAHVNISMDTAATSLSKSFETETTDLINQSANPLLAQLWNRAHLKALKMAGLIAVGVNCNQPMVTREIFIWSVDFVKKDIATLYTRFEKGDIGEGEGKQNADLTRKIEQYFKCKPRADFKKYYDQGAVAYGWLTDNVRQLASFKNDPKGGNRALKETLDALIDAGKLVLISKADCQLKFKTGGKVFGLGDEWGK